MTATYRLKNLNKLMLLDTRKADYNDGVNYTFNVQHFQLKDLAKMKTDTVSTYGEELLDHITIRVKDIEYKNNHYFSSDRSGDPTIYAGKLAGNIHEKAFEAELILPPQTINKITLNITKTVDGSALANDIYITVGFVYTEIDDQKYIEVKAQQYIS